METSGKGEEGEVGKFVMTLKTFRFVVRGTQAAKLFTFLQLSVGRVPSLGVAHPVLG